MAVPPGDIPSQMRAKAEVASTGNPTARSGLTGGAVLSPADFSSRLVEASKTLWLIAASVLGSREGAEDVVQESAVIGFQKINEFDPATNFGAWMGGIVRNVARNAARKSVRRHTGPADPMELDQSRSSRSAPTDPSFDRSGRLAASQDVFDDRVVAALSALDETPRVCLLLRTIKQMPYREIASILGIPEGTAMSHVHRARQSMRLALVEQPGGGQRA